MALIDTINNDIKVAMLAKDKEKLEALRAIKAALLIANTSGEAVKEEDEIKLLQKLVKQRKESAGIFIQNNRKDLAEVELKQLSYIEPYLPKQMGADELKKEIELIIKENNATNIKDMGKIIGLTAKKFAGKADNKVISEIVKQLLA